MAQEKPRFAPTVSEKLHGLHEQWDELETTTLKKEQTLFDANRSELYEQRFADIAKWIKDMEQQVESDEYGKDLTSVNILLSEHKVGEKLCMYSKSCYRAILVLVRHCFTVDILYQAYIQHLKIILMLFLSMKGSIASNLSLSKPNFSF